MSYTEATAVGPESCAEAADGDGHCVLVLFLSDLHAMFEGIPNVGRSGGGPIGGFEVIREFVRKMRQSVEDGHRPFGFPPATKVLVVLGGDMVRRKANRWVHRESVPRIWEGLRNGLAPDVSVCGNHECDFGSAVFARIVESWGPIGCTRNVVSVEDVGDGRCACMSRPSTIPAHSDHCILEIGDGVGPRLHFTGLMHVAKGDCGRKFGGKYVRHSASRVRDEVVAPCCLDGGKCGENDAVHIHVAHYSNVWPDHVVSPGFPSPSGIGPNKLVRPGFGLAWYDEFSKSTQRPHFVLKAHDHNASAATAGTVDRHDRREEINRDDNSVAHWVPTFGVGHDGQVIGGLWLWVRDHDIRYEWEPYRMTDATKKPWLYANLPDVEPEYAEPVVQDVRFPSFGAAYEDVSTLYRATCLMLNAMAHGRGGQDVDATRPVVALGSPSSVTYHSLVPNVGCEDYRFSGELWDALLLESQKRALGESPEESRDTIRQNCLSEQYLRKIDKWDLSHVYRTDMVCTRMLSGVEFLTAIGEILRSAKGAASRIHRTVLPPLLGAGGDGSLGNSPSLCFSWLGRAFAVLPPTGDADGAEADWYELGVEDTTHAERFSFSPRRILDDASLKALRGQDTIAVVCDRFTDRLCFSGGGGEIGVRQDKREDTRRTEGVAELLRAAHKAGKLPEVWTPGFKGLA